MRNGPTIFLALAVLAGAVHGDDARPEKAEKGKRAPALSGRDWQNTERGQGLDLEKLAGKTVLLLFVKVWDDASAELVARAKRLLHARRERGLVVIGVHRGVTAGKLKDTLAREKIEWPCFVDDETAARYGVRESPAIALIDSRSVLVGVSAA
jgi:hypothetical protein